MIYGATRAYRNHQDQDTSSSWNTYLGMAMGVSAVQNIWAGLLPAAASPNATGVGIGLLTLTSATLYQGGVMYASMLAGEQIGIVARSTNNENRELR